MRAERRAELLAAIDPDWRPDWPVDWQRHYTALAGLVTPGEVLGEVAAGTVVHGMDVGRWLATQRQDWDRLAVGQRERLALLGVTPAPRPATPARKTRQRQGAAAGGASERGIAALTQYTEREGTLVVPRPWSEELPDGT